MKRLATTMVLSTALAFPTLAHAEQTANTDTVYLREAAPLSGHVTEIVAGDHVTVIVVPGGETKRIAWSAIDRVVVGPAVPASTPRRSARVHITSRKSVVLYRQPKGTSIWERACTSPCDEELPLDERYRIGSVKGPKTDELRLEPDASGHVDLVVSPISVGGIVGGSLMSAGGAGAIAVGALLTLFGTAGRHVSPGTENNASSLVAVGVVTMVVGAALTASGIAVIVNSAKTEVSQRSETSNDAFFRQPIWKSDVASVPAATVPFAFTHRF
jgi:hypothetical protein